MSREGNHLHQPLTEFHALVHGGQNCGPQRGPWTPPLAQSVQHVHKPGGNGGRTHWHHNVKSGGKIKHHHLDANAAQVAEGKEFRAQYQVLEKFDTFN